MNRMIDAGISILGLYGYDSGLFDLLEVPEGVNRDTVISRILMTCANLPCMYTNPAFVKTAIQIWCRSHIWTWEKLQASTEFVYNPIWNKDGTITETTEYGAHTVTENRGQRQTTENRGQRQTTENRGQRETTNEDKIAGFNSAEYSNADLSTVTDAAAIDSTTEAAAIDSTTEAAAIDTTTEAAREDTTTRTEQGNIGITSTQQLIKEEREISDFSIYDYIAQDFKKEFCIMVY